MRRAAFLDRDGVLNHPIMSDGRAFAPLTLAEFRTVDGMKRDVKRLRDAGLVVIVFTNQPEVAAGLLEPRTLERMHRKLPVDDVFVCPHAPAEGCECHKPRPGMLLEAARKWDVDLASSFVVGDRWVDIDAGLAVGARTILIARPYSECLGADERVGDFRAAVDAILRGMKSPPRASKVARLPLLEGDDAVRAIAGARAYAKALSEASPLDPSLARGSAGLTILFAHLDEAFPGEGYAQATERLLDHACDALAETPMDASLFGGIAGIAWALAHLGERAGSERQQFLRDTIDPLLLAHVRATGKHEFDLVRGLTGIGVYALERLDAPLGRELLTAVVGRLIALSEPAAEGVRWEQPQRSPTAYPLGYHVLGIAHGAAGPIALLGAACAHGVAVDAARPVLDAAVAWLLSQELPEHGSASRYSHGVGRGVRPRPCRTAWCEGEPGIAAALLVAARGVGQSSWEARALEIACRAARRPLDETGVWDSGVCHGAAGLAHVFGRLHAATGEPELRDAAVGWARRALAVRRGGWLEDTRVEGEQRPPDGLLGPAGTGGIALVLLTLAGVVEPSWDRFLLLSARGVEGPRTARRRGVPRGAVPSSRGSSRSPGDPNEQQTVREVMTPGPRALAPSDSVAAAAEIMRKEDLGLLPVTDGGRLIGVVTDRDIVARVVARGLEPHDVSAGSIASRDLVTVGPETSLDAAIVAMVHGRVRRLPVVERGRLVGIVSQADVALKAGRLEAGALVRGLSWRPPADINPGPLRFRDRSDAGRTLAAELSSYHGRRDVLVLGLPRGGIVVGYEVARALRSPLDVLVVRRLVRRSGGGEASVGAIAEGGIRFLDPRSLSALGLTRRELTASVAEERRELRRRVELFRARRRPDPVRGKTVILVDDGIANGFSMRAAIGAVRLRRPAAICVAVPVGAADVCREIRQEVDDVVSLRSNDEFFSVEVWYEDYSQTSDEEVCTLLSRSRRPAGADVDSPATREERAVTVPVDGVELRGTLSLVGGAKGIVLIGHGSDSDRHSPRLRLMADVLCASGLATLILNLLSADEVERDRRAGDYHYGHDTALLAERLVGGVDWLGRCAETAGLAIGCLGTSSSGPAALIAAAMRADRVRAVATRGGMTHRVPPEAVAAVRAPTLFIVADGDGEVIAGNRATLRHLRAEARLEIVPGATHAFWEPGKIEHVARLARDWFMRHLVP